MWRSVILNGVMYSGRRTKKRGKKSAPPWNMGLPRYLCVGETLEQRKAGISDEVLSIQLDRGADTQHRRLWVAYQPSSGPLGLTGYPPLKNTSMRDTGG